METGKTAQKLAFGSTLNMVVLGANILISFFLMPFLVHSLGDRWYGVWTIVGMFMGYYGFLDFGLSGAVSRFVARASGTKDHVEMNTIINTSLALFCGIGLISLIVSLGVAVGSPFFIDDRQEAILFSKVMVIMGISVGLGFPMHAFAGVLISKVRYDLSASLRLFKLFTRAGLMVYFIGRGHGIMAMALITFSVDIAGYIIQFYFVKSVFPEISFGRRWFQKTRIKTLFNYSKYSVLNNLADHLKFKVDSFVIAGFLNASLVTHYYIAGRLIEYFSQFMQKAVGTLTPVFSQYEGRGDFEGIRKWLLSGTRISTMLSFFVGSSLIFYGKAFIERWMGTGYESSYTVLVLLSSAMIFDLMQTPGVGALFGISKHKYYAIANCVEAVLNLAFSLILVRYYGIIGVALGTALEMYLFKLFIQPVYTCHAIQVPFYDYVIKTIGLTAIKTLLPLGVFFAIIHRFVKPDFLSIFTLAGIQIVLLGPLIVFFVFNKYERKVMIDALFGRVVSSLFRKFARQR